jgi:hypothetical protein
MEFLTALDQDVEITVRPKRESEGKISVSRDQFLILGKQRGA